VTITQCPPSRPIETARRGAGALTATLFVVYAVLLAWTVLWKLDMPWIGGVGRVVKLVPFIAADGEGASEPLEVAANLALFIPIGMFLALLAPRWGWLKTTAVVAAGSAALELTQYVLAIGRTDVTDVIANAAGGLVGYVLVALAEARSGADGRMRVARISGIITLIGVVAAAVFIALPLRYGSPPDHDGMDIPRGASSTLSQR